MSVVSAVAFRTTLLNSILAMQYYIIEEQAVMDLFSSILKPLSEDTSSAMTVARLLELTMLPCTNLIFEYIGDHMNVTEKMLCRRAFDHGFVCLILNEAMFLFACPYSRTTINRMALRDWCHKCTKNRIICDPFAKAE